jgi:hypothetical protein
VLFGYTNLSGLSTRRLVIHSKAKGKETDDLFGNRARADFWTIQLAGADKDSLAERGEFELPVPIYEQSDDSIRLSFVPSRRNCKALSPRSALLVRFRRRVTH